MPMEISIKRARGREQELAKKEQNKETFDRFEREKISFLLLIEGKNSLLT